MNIEDEPVELGRVASAAAFALAAVGIAALGAGFQVFALVLFRSPTANLVPWLEMAAGAGFVWLAPQLAHPRRWAPALALAALVALGLASGAWAAWLLLVGFASPLLLLVPAATLPAIGLLLAAWAELRRVAAVRAAAEAEFAQLRPAPTGNRWLLPLAYTGLGLLLVPVLLLLFAPARAQWLVTRGRGLLAGRSPFAAARVEQAVDYPYGGSPLAWYLETEARFTPVPVEAVLEVADGLSDDVAWRLSAATGLADPVEAERALWAAGRQRELPEWIAEELRARQVFYAPESLFSRSFDPEAHLLPDQVHLDCDQLVWVFLHVASRLDLAMSAVPSPLHVYLRYAGPAGEPPLYVETTEFRSVERSADRVDFMGEGVGDGFWIAEDHHASGRGGTWASPELVAAAGLYQPWTEADIRDAILGNVLVGVTEAGLPVDAVAEAEKVVAGSRDITLVANLYRAHVEAAQGALRAQDRERARAEAERARAMRAEFGPLVVSIEAVEEEILAGL